VLLAERASGRPEGLRRIPAFLADPDEDVRLLAVKWVADLVLESRESDEGAVVVVRGEVDMATAPQLRDALFALVDGGATRIALDCRGLDFLDSSGIGVLIAVRKRLGDDGSLTLEAPPAHVRKVLELTGVSEHVTITS